jgi:hypothetical protein
VRRRSHESSRRERVLDQAGALVSTVTDEQLIEEDVDWFRAFLGEVDPIEFEKHQGPDPPEGPT